MIILDTTLREGEQTPNVSFSVEEKLKLARMLDEFGVEMIEAGHPAVSPQIYKVVKTLAHEGLNAEILAHVRAVRSDIDKALECDVSRVAIFLPTSDIHLTDKLRITEDEALHRITTEIEYAHDHGLKIRYTPEDSTRTRTEFLLEACKTAVEAGADRISIADTVGIATPANFSKLIKLVHENIQAKIDVHCHNDLGLALANGLAAIEAGADCVHATINGIGERCGIVDLASLSLSSSMFLGQEGKYKLEMLPTLSNYVEKISGMYIAPNAPVIGKTAFTHKSGVHTDGVLKNPHTYEAYDPIIVGRERNIAIDKYTGKLAVKQKLQEYGVTVADNDLLTIVNCIKELGDKQKNIHDSDILSIMEQVTGRSISIIPHHLEALVNLKLQSNIYSTTVVRRISNIVGVERVYEMIGEDDVGAYISVNTVNHLNNLIEEIRTIPGIASTSTKMILKSLDGVGIHG